MKTLFTFITLFIFTMGNANEGQDLYKATCAACHTIGKGRLVGPDLKDITQKRSQDWLNSFIKSSTKMIQSGDADAVAISKEYNGLLMPDNAYSDSQVLSILGYIEQGGSGSDQGASAPVDILSGVTDENIHTGAMLFSGKKPLANGGSACSSCHSVKDERIFSGGTLAKDLTETWDVMGSAGVAAIIKSSPFPVMNMAYHGRLLTEDEVIDLTSYLKSVSQERYYQRSSDFSLLFAIFGIIFFKMILLTTLILYFKRKSRPVNYEILSRHSKVVN